MKFVILKTTIGDRESYQRQLEAHRRYLDDLARRMHLVVAGTFDDRTGGMLVIEARDLEQAIGLAREDPLVRAGIDRYLVRPWTQTAAASGSLAIDDRPIRLADTGPIQIPLFEEAFRIIDVREHPARDQLLAQCFIPEHIAATDPGRRSYLRSSRPRGMRKLLLMHGEEVAGQIEFAPAGASGVPVSGRNLAVINCIWVTDAYTGLGGGGRLLAACAEESGASALATVAYNAALPLMSRGFFDKHGFAAVDEVETGRFFGNTPIVAYLLWRPLRDNLDPPTWDKDALLAGLSFCPGYPWLYGRQLYWGDDFAYHGMVVKEGLRRPELLFHLPRLGSHRTGKWTFVKFGVPEADLTRAIELVQTALLNEPPYYAHLYGQDRVVIIFPDRVFQAERDPQSWVSAIQYGVEQGIPEEELVFSPGSFDEETF